MPTKPSLVARLSRWSAIDAVGAMALGVVGSKIGLLSPIAGFFLFAIGLGPLAILTLILGLFGIYRTRATTGLDGRRLAIQGSAVGALLLVVFAALAGGAGGVPPIHDITTDPDDPPQFIAAAAHPDNEGRDLTYPHGGDDVTTQQRQGYPDLAPIKLDTAPAATFSAAIATAEELGWEVVDQDATSGRIEATSTSATFSFIDDIVVRIRTTGSGSVVDLRSTSRVGQSDLGANAARIQAFRDAIVAH